ncbi:hypothetical protein J32TS2_19150 [Shouchella clausii]|nr:hypothetical protein J32TS2_19150 [Shouchella clausii]
MGKQTKRVTGKPANETLAFNGKGPMKLYKEKWRKDRDRSLRYFSI